jgi:hypothetical protein
MTRDEILSMEAGRELDALVAEQVMGWKRETYSFNNWRDGKVESMELSGLMGPDGLREVDQFPFYSTDIAAAWEVVEKLEEENIARLELTRLGWDWQKTWRVSFFTTAVSEGAIVEGDIVPLTICRAALLALEEPC